MQANSTSLCLFFVVVANEVFRLSLNEISLFVANENN